MMRRLLACIMTAAITLAVVACAPSLGISRYPAPDDFRRGRLAEIPTYDPESDDPLQVDLRGYDLSALSVVERADDLLCACFDDDTLWPTQLPEQFEPNRIMELGKDPGLGLGRLHAQGITGKGIGIAVIDQTLLVDHVEYGDRLRHYEEIHNQGDVSTMHGAAVASIAVGRTVGVAPEADLYYIAETHGDYSPEGFRYDFTWLAKSVDRILDLNRSLPTDQKIRVISASVGWNPSNPGYQEITAAVERAKRAGVFVVSSSLARTFDLTFHGLGRDPYADPNDANSFRPGSWWAREYYRNPEVLGSDTLLFPMDARCVASPTGAEDYVYYYSGGWSWAIPYVAGLYALACQVRPEVTPDEFWQVGLETGDWVTFAQDGRQYQMGTVVNPERLLAALSGR